MNYVLPKILVVSALINFTLSHFKDRCGPLFLTVEADTDTKIIMNWKFTCKDHPDTLLLCSSAFSNGCKDTLAKFSHIHSTHGTFRTSISFGYHEKLPGGWEEHHKHPRNGSHCFSYWLISVRNNKMIDENCLKIHPTWMENFGKLRLENMMITGTHNSGTWKGMPVLAKNFILNQDRNLWDQLVFGIRFFDLRIGYKSGHSKFWVNHDFVYVTELELELEHVAEFLRKTRTEIVILNFHRFPGSTFSTGTHKKLIDLLQTLFSDFILSPAMYAKKNKITLEDIWKTGKRLILSYNNREILQEYNWLWGGINRKWGDKDEVEPLHNYIRDVLKTDVRPLYVIMAELTPSAWTFLKYHSLRAFADLFNPHLNNWLRYEHWDEKVNIIAVDFFLSTDIVNIAIEANKKRLNTRRCNSNKIQFY